MSVQSFFAAVLPSQGHRFILTTFGKQGDPDFRPSQVAFAPGDEADAIKRANWGSQNGANAYFASGGFLPPPIDPETQQPKGGRTADRVTHFRCLRIDVDCGEGKPYADKKAGLAALVAFCNHYGMPMPWIVDSGYGLHVYWAFDRDVTTMEWLGMAQRLATGCVAAGFHVDTTTTLDAARVLRVPGTTNYKRGGKVAVRIVADGVATDPAVLVQRLPAGDMSLAGAVPAAMRGMASELQQNLHTPYTLRGVLSACPGMTAMLGDGGARAQEPLWKAALDLIWKSDDALTAKEKVARAVSTGHAGFNEASFAGKWKQVQQQDYHPPTCKQFAAAGMPECAACPMRGRISSPLVLGYPQAPVQAKLSAVPAPVPEAPSVPLIPLPSFQVGVFNVVDSTRVEITNGFLTKKLKIFDGKPMLMRERKLADGTVDTYFELLLDYRIVEVERLLDAIGQKSLTAITFDRGLDKRVRIEFTNAELTDARQFHSAMIGNGLYTSRKDVTNLMEVFMPEFLTQLQRARAANRIAGRCGWTDDYKGFVIGTHLLSAGGSEHVRPGAIPEEMLAYHAMGDEVQWRRAMEIVLRGGPDRQAVVALAIASPLMVFTGLDGVMLNAFSPESGVGKSTLGDAAVSIWGSPDALRKSARDTANATWRIAGVTGNMPMVIDEFTNVDGRALSDFVYTVTQGREKHRLTSEAKLQAGGAQRWCLAAITTANNSVHDKLQAYRSDAVAEASRVFDLRLHPLSIPAADLGRLKTELQALRTNYGFLGPRLAALFLSKPASFWRERIMEKISQWDNLVATNASDRFRSACAALIEVGAAVGAAMDLSFDLPEIRKVVEQEWRRQLSDFEDERRKPMDFIKGYLNDYMGEFLTTGGVNGEAVMTSAPRRYRGEIKGRTVDGKWHARSVMIPQDLLRNFVRENNGNYKAFNEWLRLQLGTGVVMRIGRLTYLEGQMQQYTTQAVEFSTAVLTEQVLLQVVPAVPTAIPSAPARAIK
jgi:hypothetical protein